MTEKAKEFMAAMAQDEELMNRMKEADSVDRALEIAKKKGYDLTAEDFAKAGGTDDINEDELQAVAGGWKSCGCVAGGYGKADPSDGSGSCSCALIGFGFWADGTGRCMCPGAGGGAGVRDK